MAPSLLTPTTFPIPTHPKEFPNPASGAGHPFHLRGDRYRRPRAARPPHHTQLREAPAPS
eukprot:scaffold2718_cov103-Isochrysis_galbana.AAC.17